MAKHLAVVSKDTTDSLNRNEVILQNSLKNIFTAEKIKELLAEKIDEVFTRIICNFFDAEHFYTQFGFYKSLPEPDPPYFNYEVFSQSVKYIEVSEICIIK